MDFEVLLMDDVPKLGAAGDVVRVSGGYARNFLLPKKLAQPVGQAAMRRLEKLRAERAEAAKRSLAEARRVAEALAKTSCTVSAKTTDGSTLYGSVTAADIAAAIVEQHYAVDRHQIVLESPIKEVGTYDVQIRLHPEVSLNFKVWVVDAGK